MNLDGSAYVVRSDVGYSIYCRLCTSGRRSWSYGPTTLDDMTEQFDAHVRAVHDDDPTP